MRRDWRVLVCAVLVTFVMPLAGVTAAPEAQLWERWADHAPDSTTTIDHGWWTGFLIAYVEPGDDGINRFAYGRVSRAHKNELKHYVARLAGLPIEQYNRDEQFAYWVNLYNALSIDVMLDHYPVVSIVKLSISPGLFAIGPWGKKLVVIGGEDVSLNDIVHRILRPIWRYPRTHYAINCSPWIAPTC